MNKSIKGKGLLVALFGLMALTSCGEETPVSSSTASGDTLPTYTVSFYGGFTSIDGANSKDVSVKAGAKVSSITPVRTGYSFVSWDVGYDKENKNGTGDTYDFTLPVNSNFTLYAEWSKQSTGSHTQAEVDAYVDGLKTSSSGNHLYIHYYRFGNAAESYNDWDVWCWPYKPDAGEGMRFDWKGRTQDTTSNTLAASGTAIPDDFGGAVCDIDLTKTYNGGWDSTAKKIGGKTVSFYQTNDTTKLDTSVAFQIVKSATRTSSSGFWANDGSNQPIDLADYAYTNSDGSTSYHVFYLQDTTGSRQNLPYNDYSDPFDQDDGTNVTYGNNTTYNTASWTDKAKMPTSPEFLKGSEGGATNSSLKYGAGVGYQIMVSSFADSDGDGFGDIYGIEQKLDYIKKLGVNVLWLTPIQKSDSYHGYDITDYNVLDPKFGSKTSPAGVENGGLASEETTLADYKSLLSKAHENNMCVIMDLVLNHTSTANNWFTESAQLNDEYRGFYQWGNNKTQTDIKESNYWYPYGDHVYSYYAKFGSSMPELNYMYAPTRKAVFDMAKNWCSMGVDGFRLDAVKHIFLKDEIGSLANGDTIVNDQSTAGDYSSDLTKNLNFFKELNYEVKSVYPNAFFVGENFDGNAYQVSPYYEAFDSMFDFYSYFNVTSLAAFGNGKTDAKQSAGAWMRNSSTYDGSGISDGSGIMNTAKGKAWNIVDVVKTYNSYRGDTAIMGAFTSNHDIARIINRIHFSSTDSNGIAAQGNVTTSDYAAYNKLADLAKIAELMLPGCTWIYYGDEIGMTGNFPSGTTSSSSYSDLWYRQPMKWKQGGTTTDNSFTCSYNVTGSGLKVTWDEVNASTSVVDAVTQAASSTSSYAKIAKFANLKGTTPALIRGDLTDDNSTDTILKFKRTLSGVTYSVAIDFSALTASVTGGGSTINY